MLRVGLVAGLCIVFAAGCGSESADPGGSATAPDSSEAVATTASAPDANHPKTLQDLATAYKTAYDAGDEQAILKLIHWGKSTAEQQKITKSLLARGAGQHKIKDIKVLSADSVDVAPGQWTLQSDEVIEADYTEFDGDSPGSKALQCGLVDGHAYFGGWAK